MEVKAAQPQRGTKAVAPPALLCELEPWHRVFRRNLADLLLHREPPPLETTSEPVPVPPDTFIRTGLGIKPFAESGLGHIAFIALVYFFSTSTLFNRPVQLHSPFENTKVSYYPLSDYLPPLNTGQKGEAQPRKGSPKLAKQEILSVPESPDNTHQTIVTPPKLKLTEDVKLPNIVAWTPTPGPPIAATSRQLSQLQMPQFQAQVVEPTADVSKLKSKLNMPAMAQPSVVEPTADVSKLKNRMQAPMVAQPSVVEPPLSPDQLKLKRGEMNMAQLSPQVEAPKLPVAAQRAGGPGEAGSNNAGPQTAPAQPNVQGLQSTHGQGQIIALGLSPADVHGPIDVPNGNRSGEFHASPGGKPDAPGTPNTPGTSAATGTGVGGGKGSGSGNGNSNAPTGITVGAPPPGATTSAVTGTPSKTAGDQQQEDRRKIIAAAMKPSIPSAHQAPPPPTTLTETGDDALEKQVFGKRKYYSLVMNMPNLTSATGSWIIRFAELNKGDDKTAVLAPVALSKVDPAYPADVMRDRIEGTVTLYALIHADGSVDGIKVLNSVDDRLDQSAIKALSRWRFRPGTKNGDAVELEAVVQIPFRLRHTP